MPERIHKLQPPTGFVRFVLRIPVWLYAAGLGRLLGRRFLELTHVGRKSGKLRRTVLEVVRFDPAGGIYYIAAGFGEKSDWYQNIQKNSQVTVTSGGKRFSAVAIQLTPVEAGRELLTYAHCHPLAFRELTHFMGLRVNQTEADIFALGQFLPMFALKPDPR